MEWLAKQHEEASRRAPEETIAIESKIPLHDKGKRKIFDRMEEEKSYKFRVDPLVEKASLAIEAKRQQRDKQNVQR